MGLIGNNLIKAKEAYDEASISLKKEYGEALQAKNEKTIISAAYEGFKNYKYKTTIDNFTIQSSSIKGNIDTKQKELDYLNDESNEDVASMDTTTLQTKKASLQSEIEQYNDKLKNLQEEVDAVNIENQEFIDKLNDADNIILKEESESNKAKEKFDYAQNEYNEQMKLVQTEEANKAQNTELEKSNDSIIDGSVSSNAQNILDSDADISDSQRETAIWLSGGNHKMSTNEAQAYGNMKGANATSRLVQSDIDSTNQSIKDLNDKQKELDQSFQNSVSQLKSTYAGDLGINILNAENSFASNKINTSFKAQIIAQSKLDLAGGLANVEADKYVQELINSNAKNIQESAKQKIADSKSTFMSDTAYSSIDEAHSSIVSSRADFEHLRDSAAIDEKIYETGSRLVGNTMFNGINSDNVAKIEQKYQREQTIYNQIKKLESEGKTDTPNYKALVDSYMNIVNNNSLSKDGNDKYLDSRRKGTDTMNNIAIAATTIPMGLAGGGYAIAGTTIANGMNAANKIDRAAHDGYGLSDKKLANIAKDFVKDETIGITLSLASTGLQGAIKGNINDISNLKEFLVENGSDALITTIDAAAENKEISQAEANFLKDKAINYAFKLLH